MHRAAVVLAMCLLTPACAGDVDLNFSSSPVGLMASKAYRVGATTDGSTWWWVVPFEDVMKSPDWQPGEEPPLPVSKAIQLAEAEVPTYTETPRAYRLDTVEWVHVGNHMGDGRKWIYVVNFERRYNFEGQSFPARGTLKIPVLLDGRVIKGQKE